MDVAPRKSKVAPATLRGMRDFLPPDAIFRHQVIETLRGVFERFGFDPLETPAIEYAETLKGKYGEEADKLIYEFQDRGGRQVGLRYDLTVPLSRVVANNPDLPRPFKRYQIAPVWRAESPQKGRYREFWQCDVDVVGSASPLADAEVVNVYYAALRALGMDGFRIRINNRKLLGALIEYAGAPAEQARVILQAVDKLDKIGPSGVRDELRRREVAAPVIDRLFDFIQVQGASAEVLRELQTRFGDHPLAREGIDELIELVGYLEHLGVPAGYYQIDLSMVRGLEYYTGPIFEAVVEEPKIGSIGGGGRYDRLIGMFSRQDIPATGISAGLDRIVLVMEELGVAPAHPRSTVSQVLVAVFGPETASDALRLASELRAAGIAAEVYLGFERLPNQLRYAARKGIPFVAIAGPDEIAGGTVALKDMAAQDQVSVARDELVAAVRARLQQ